MSSVPDNAQAAAASGTPLLQIIDAEGNFTPAESFKDPKLGLQRETGNDYFVAAVLGAQSSGKSTLLNLLFGTDFAVRDGRTQTTQGIWMGSSRCFDSSKVEKEGGNASNLAPGVARLSVSNLEGRQAEDLPGKPDAETIVVLDVEGTDGSERGEDSFERKTSLFSLALAEVLLINMWHHDVGRFHGGNMSLLKNVLELNIQLFGQKPSKTRTLLLFIIRDYMEEESALDDLATLIKRDLEKIWKEFEDSELLAAATSGRKLTDLFDLQFTGIPHKFYAKAQFEESAAALRARFEDHASPDFLFRPEFKGDVPADGFPMLCRQVWETIQGSKDVDLPTQKEMVANLRCDEIIASVREAFSENLDPIREELSDSKAGDALPLPPVADLGRRLGEAVDSALAEFIEHARRYDKNVVGRKQVELSSLLAKEVHGEFFAKQLQRLSDFTLAGFERDMQKLDPSGDTAEESTLADDFSNRSADASLSAMRAFVEGAVASVLPSAASVLVDSPTTVDTGDAVVSSSQSASWSFQSDVQRVATALKTRVDAARKHQASASVIAAVKNVESALGKWLMRSLENPGPSFWPDVREKFFSARASANDDLIIRLRQHVRIGATMSIQVKGRETFVVVSEADQAAIDDSTERFKKASEAWLKSVFEDKSKYIGAILERRFNALFLNTDEGIPRRWGPSDDLAGIFISARTRAESLLEYYALLRLDPAMDDVRFVPPRLFEQSPSSSRKEEDDGAGAGSPPPSPARRPQIPEEHIVIPVEECEAIRDRFDATINTQLANARNQQEQVVSKSHIPVWVIFFMLYLGFDEAWHLATHPGSLIMLVIALGIGFVVWKLGLISGPMQKAIDLMVHTNISNFQKAVQEWARKFESAPVASDSTERKPKRD